MKNRLTLLLFAIIALAACRKDPPMGEDTPSAGPTPLSLSIPQYVTDSGDYLVYVANNPLTDRPALFRRIDGGNARELARNVDNMQIFAGVDGNEDRQTDEFVEDLSTVDWAQVRAIRVVLTMLSEHAGLTDDIFFEGYPRVIYIHRDYRDALISYYYFVLAYKFFDGTFSEFIRSNIVLRHGSWKQHIKAMKKYKQENPDKILVLSYESLLNNFDKSVESINRFCGFKKEVDLNKLKEKTSFRELKKMENEFGSRFMSNTK